ncbi:hypothetical protein [Micromonospora palythoicola]|uniref:hypothetical protein n=1 Tax=Micromonospora palythoicola TaxID=3120507 RepID=UPI002FCE6453
MIDRHGGAWTLHRRDGGGVLAELVVNGGDFPWLNARVDPGEGLAQFRPLFAEELRLLDAIDEDVESWERAYEAVRNAVTLRYPDGQEVPEFLLHLDGDEAWWRWSDEPFDEQNA